MLSLWSVMQRECFLGYLGTRGLSRLDTGHSTPGHLAKQRFWPTLWSEAATLGLASSRCLLCCPPAPPGESHNFNIASFGVQCHN